MKYFDRNTWFWVFLAALFFIPFLGGVHLFDWDEVNFAELAREMTITGDYLQMQMNYAPFTEKPPLFFWLQALAMNIFGDNEFSARFPNAFLGLLVLPVLYISGKFIVDRKFGFLWAMSWFGSTLPFLYFKSGIIDPWFNFFIFNGLFFLIHFIWKKQNTGGLYFSRPATSYLVLAGIFTGLGILTKGPVAVLLILLCGGVYWILRRFKSFISLKDIIIYGLITIGITFLWFGLDILINGGNFIMEFTIRQWELLTTSDAGHKGFPGYHFIVLLIGCFPASLLAIKGMQSTFGMPAYILDFKRWMVILLFVVLILFSLVGTKIIHYSSMAYYPISFLSALALYNIMENRYKTGPILLAGIILFQIIIITASIALPYIAMHIDDFKYLFEKDPFALANLNAEINWSMLDYIPALVAIIIVLLFGLLIGYKKKLAYKILFFGNALWVFACLIFLIGKIERISQNASVEFFSEKQGQEVYVATYKYKSYIPWYYAKVMPYENPKANDNQWLLYGDTDRPVFISCKITAHEDLEKNIKDARFLYEKNGFYFYQRN